MSTQVDSSTAPVTDPGDSGSSPPSSLGTLYRRHREVLRLLVIVAALWVVLAVMAPHFLTFSNVTNIFINAAPLALVAAGLTLVIIAGDLDLSAGSALALVSTVSAILMVDFGVPWVLAFVMGIVLGGVAGLVNGLLVTRIGIPSFITTLAAMSTLRGIALLISDGSAVAGLPDPVTALARTRFVGLPVVLWFPIVVIPVLGFILSRTNLGLSIYAIGGNREAARIAGVAISRTRVTVLTISGLLAGVAAVIMTARLGVGSPIIASTLAMDAITAVVIGGTSLFGGAGRMSGTVLGVVLIASLQNGLVLLDVSAYWQQIAVGLVLVVAVAIDALSSRRRG